jgi:hypothetical protein
LRTAAMTLSVGDGLGMRSSGEGAADARFWGLFRGAPRDLTVGAALRGHSSADVIALRARMAQCLPMGMLPRLPR